MLLDFVERRVGRLLCANRRRFQIATFVHSSLGAEPRQFGLELEGLSPEDREFEASKQFVRFAGQTVANALQADPSGDPEADAHAAAVDAARIHAPGLMNIAGNGRHEQRHDPRSHSGRWIRHRDRIILFGV